MKQIRELKRIIHKYRSEEESLDTDPEERGIRWRSSD